MTGPHRRFRLDRRVSKWLLEGGPGEDADSYEDAAQNWVLHKMSRGEVLDVRGVMVDRVLLDARFECLPERCSPAAVRGRYRSCCADLRLTLSRSEQGRLLRFKKSLGEHLGNADVSYWLEEDGAAVARPNGRCAFSKIERDGRIRCRLHAFARAGGMKPGDLQPFSCGLFPLALLAVTPGRVLVTVLQKTNYKLLGSLPPDRFPCLSDPELPPLIETMRGTLDRLFGKGFARAIPHPLLGPNYS